MQDINLHDIFATEGFVNDKLDNKELKFLTKDEYDKLETKDKNTLYFLTDNGLLVDNSKYATKKDVANIERMAKKYFDDFKNTNNETYLDCDVDNTNKIINCKSFNDNILKVIEEMSFNFYIINLDKDKTCTCVLHQTSQADPNCRKCLGTGHKITIRKIRGACQETGLQENLKASNYSSSKNYYIKSSYKLNKDDIAVDEGKPYIIFETQKIQGIHGTLPYIKVSTVKKRYDCKIFTKNFLNIINRKR